MVRLSRRNTLKGVYRAAGESPYGARMLTTTSRAQRAPRSGATRARRIVVLAATACVAASLALAAPSAGAATPPLPRDTHCPAGFKLLPFAAFDPIYLSFLEGQDLNGNGLICSHQFADPAAAALLPKFPMLPPGSPLYLVADDSIAS